MSNNNNKFRFGRFTSSEIWQLAEMGKRPMTEQEMIEHKMKFPKSKKTLIEAGFSKAGLSYIQEKNFERLLGRSINTESNARPLAYGKFVESRVFDLLGLDYTLTSQETMVHPEISFWSGSADGIKHNSDGLPETLYDIKCPFTILSYCKFADCRTIDEVREKHPDGEKYYWQIISGAAINNCSFGELIFYVPYKSELESIREMVRKFDGDQNKIAFINWSSDNELPWLPDGGYFKNIHIVRFEIPRKDIDYLTSRVLEAGKMLIEPKVLEPEKLPE